MAERGESDLKATWLFLYQAAGFVGGAWLRGVLIEDYGYGNILQKILEVPFVFKRADKSAVLHFIEDFDGNAAGDVHASEGKNLECKITGFGAVDVGPQVEGFHAHWTGFLERVLGDFGGRVGVGIGEGWMLDGRVQKLVNGEEAAT